MKARNAIALTLSAAFIIAACGGDDESSATLGPTAVSAATTEAPVTTEAPATTAAPTTMDAPEAPETTEPPAPTVASTEAWSGELVDLVNTAVVWGSGVDASRVNAETPQPSWEVGATVVVLDMVGILDGTEGSDTGRACADEIEFARSDEQTCLFFQFRFNVSADATESGAIFVSDLVTAAGRQLDAFASEQGRPGTVGNLLVFAIPGGGPESRIFFDIDGGLGFRSFESDIEYVVPGPEQFKPVDFFQD